MNLRYEVLSFEVSLKLEIQKKSKSKSKLIFFSEFTLGPIAHTSVTTKEGCLFCHIDILQTMGAKVIFLVIL
jgi:hypothetical protein